MLYNCIAINTITVRTNNPNIIPEILIIILIAFSEKIWKTIHQTPAKNNLSTHTMQQDNKPVYKISSQVFSLTKIPALKIKHKTKYTIMIKYKYLIYLSFSF